MRKHLYVDSVDLATYGVYVSGQGTFGAPSMEYTFYAIPGRDGSVPGADTRLNNINVSYDCFIYSNFETNMRNLRSFLLSRNGYVRITDDYDTTHYRMGIYEGPLDPKVTQMNNAAKFTLTFNCKPQRFLLSGDTEITIPLSSGTTQINNPTRFNAKPLFKITGYGSYYVGGVNIIISQLPTTYVIIDCETFNCYNPNYSLNNGNLSSYVTFQVGSEYNTKAPSLPPGNNAFPQPPATITQLLVTPRWWEV